MESELPAASPAASMPAAPETSQGVLAVRRPAIRQADGRWPTPLGPAAYHGIVGGFVRSVEEHTEADPAALLIQFLAAAANVIGRGPHFTAEADRHPMNMFVGIVGASSRGRKGSSWGIVKRVMRDVDPDWTANRIHTGLSSGEGVIWAVRDALPEGGKEGGPDDGVLDKRLLAYAPELASLLKVMTREGNTLSAVLRDAWDAGRLATLTKNSPATASNAHVSLVGHVTTDELRRYLSNTEVCNGFANRFLWVCAKRSKILPEGGRLIDPLLRPTIEAMVDAVEFARGIDELFRDDPARERWCEVYPGLTADRFGVFGAVTARAEAQVMRLACIYAALDRSTLIRLEHLEAALEVWRYCDESCSVIFGNRLGNPTADEILGALLYRPQGMARDEIRDLFSRHRTASEIDLALEILNKAGLVERSAEATGGRPATRWRVRPSSGSARNANDAR